MVDTFVAAAESISIGYGLDESVQMGPLRDPGKKQNVLRYIQSGIDQGATLRLDGILDKTGRLPLDGEARCFQASRCKGNE